MAHGCLIDLDDYIFGSQNRLRAVRLSGCRLARRGAHRLVRLFALVSATASAGFFCMHDSCHASVLLFGLFDMSPRGFVDIICTSKAHPLDGPLPSSLLESMCDELFLFSQSHSLLEMFAASHLDVECLELLAPLSWTSKLVRVDFSVVLFDPHAAKRGGLSLRSSRKARGGLRICRALEIQYLHLCSHR
jgi:hypothetical protein